MKPELKFLSKKELLYIHNVALDLLEDMGIELLLEEARDILKEGGAKVEGNIVKIPRELVAKAIKTAPKRDEFVLYGRNEENDIRINESAPVLAAMTMATQVIDLETREKRPATDEDLVHLTRVCEKLENVSIASALVTPQDVPQRACDWYTWATSIKNTTKHITGGAVGKEGVRDAIRMASLAVGSEEAFLERPFISFWVLTMPPMKIDNLTLEVLIEASRYKVPSIISSGGILGLTSPITIESALAHTHAEILACIALSQIINPGTPVVYTSFVRSMDMRTSNVSMSSPEFAIMKSCMGELGRFLNLPTRMPAMLRDAKVLDAQAGFETGMVGTIGAMASDIIEGMQFDMDMVVDYADLPYCNECMAQIKRVMRGVDITDSRLALDVLFEIGHGGNFLSHTHTVSNFRKEIFMPKLAERGMWGDWEKSGSLDIKDKSLKLVRKMVEESKDMELLDEETQKKIDQIAYEASLKYK
ncbi:trimethylamine methyltransferase family protein [Maledivibacter halophilus]|uniref:Trimethylamine---corrinoid protein Co-methyltransferase n=1 Tax=Maledivibacter halophilus TaxID=36842 RepID=A0A1T5L3P9_9FIRM|nr:trimethylamine methyltransferase family protein [Maledivibacter halophilus]SKC70553.1 trimethylamine---corrinoid protein Co-methyltransferase [Maledivibacter halophilus]